MKSLVFSFREFVHDMHAVILFWLGLCGSVRSCWRELFSDLLFYLCFFCFFIMLVVFFWSIRCDFYFLGNFTFPQLSCIELLLVDVMVRGIRVVVGCSRSVAMNPRHIEASVVIPRDPARIRGIVMSSQHCVHVFAALS